jgi:septal ring factor EnvC (AmiA/AmiB activator)
MPARPTLVAETIARFDTAGLRSQLLKLDTATLEALGLLLSDRERSVADAAQWLNQELGGSDDEPAVNKNAVYRFADHFRRLYGQVRAEHARRIARLRVEDATVGHVDTMSRVATARLVDLITERLVETDNLEELSGTEISAAIATLDGVSKARFKEQELALKAAESEQRVAKLQAQIEELRAEQERRKIERQRAAAHAKAEVDVKAQTAGGTVSREDVYRIIDQIMRGEAA